MDKRGAGILLHITSIPGRFGIGDLGPEAFRFVDFLADTGLRFWQILPLNPTNELNDNSPYKSISAFAFNPLLISPELLIEDGFLSRGEVPARGIRTGSQVDYGMATRIKGELLRRAWEQFERGANHPEFRTFCRKNSSWLDDFALFSALHEHFSGRIWNLWPAAVRDRQEDELARYRNLLHDDIEKAKFFQFLFLKQWERLKAYCADRDIQIIGDIPIYVALDSADVWTHPHLFKLDREKQPQYIAGVPPDYFSETGQLWGNPVYRWDIMHKNGYAWWLKRLEHNLARFDIVRIDHFRGLVGYWQVPQGEETAINGEWIKAPADDFLSTVVGRFSDLPIIAEDLGLITPDVRAIMKKYGLPCMKVLQFGFSGSVGENEHAPHNAVKNCFLFTGTHDNNTARGWYAEDATREERRNISRYLGRRIRRGTIHRELIRAAMMSVSNTVIIPMQDFLGLGSRARMNRPFMYTGNWRWRMRPGGLTAALVANIRRLMTLYGRDTRSA
ncbi:4-alpha-glucanotransferase [bacterium]|nr:4-alpha-glucanotransferase [bacterium]